MISIIKSEILKPEKMNWTKTKILLLAVVLIILLIVFAKIFFSFSLSSKSWPGLNYENFVNTKAESLSQAVENENLDKIEHLVNEEKIPVDFQDSLGNTLLKVAILTEKKKSIKKLLELGANPNIRNKANETPFLFACDQYKFDGSDIGLIDLMLKHGADINTAQISLPENGYYFRTPLIVSIDRSSINQRDKLFYFLINKGADINQYGQNPSFCAVVEASDADRMDLLRYLIIERKANIPEYSYIWDEGTKNEKRETLVQYLSKKDYKAGSKNYLLRKEILEYLSKNDQLSLLW